MPPRSDLAPSPRRTPGPSANGRFQPRNQTAAIADPPITPGSRPLSRYPAKTLGSETPDRRNVPDETSLGEKQRPHATRLSLDLSICPVPATKWSTGLGQPTFTARKASKRRWTGHSHRGTSRGLQRILFRRSDHEMALRLSGSGGDRPLGLGRLSMAHLQHHEAVAGAAAKPAQARHKSVGAGLGSLHEACWTARGRLFIATLAKTGGLSNKELERRGREVCPLRLSLMGGSR